MTAVLAICVAVVFAVSVYLMLGRELKGIAMGVFLLGHAANLSIIAMSGSPVLALSDQGGTKAAPLVKTNLASPALADYVDPLPQALILTAIVIGFAVMGFMLTLLVITSRSAHTLELDDLAQDPALRPATPSALDGPTTQGGVS